MFKVSPSAIVTYSVLMIVLCSGCVGRSGLHLYVDVPVNLIVVVVRQEILDSHK